MGSLGTLLGNTPIQKLIFMAPQARWVGVWVGGAGVGVARWGGGQACRQQRLALPLAGDCSVCLLCWPRSWPRSWLWCCKA